jgi:hypothetical protein
MQRTLTSTIDQTPDPLGETLLELYFERGFGAGYARAIRDELGTLSGVTERFIERGDSEIKAAAPVLRRLLAEIHRGLARLEPPSPVETETTYVPLQQAAISVRASGLAQ